MLYSKEQVKDYLPHRDPFLFVDGVEALVLPSNEEPDFNQAYNISNLVGAKSICQFRVTKEMIILEGHFPGNPILPGVVQVEMMAQSASFVSTLCLKSKNFKESRIEVILLGVDKSRFRKPIYPEANLRIISTLKKVRGKIQVFDSEVYCEEQLFSQAEILASLSL